MYTRCKRKGAEKDLTCCCCRCPRKSVKRNTTDWKAKNISGDRQQRKGDLISEALRFCFVFLRDEQSKFQDMLKAVSKNKTKQQQQIISSNDLS